MNREERLAFEKLDFISKVKLGVPRLHAAFDVGWDGRKLDRLLKDKDFASEVSDAEAFDIESIEQVLHDKAIGGHMEAIKMVLVNRAPERWSEKREVLVHGTQQVLVAHIDATTDALRAVLTDPSTRQRALDALGPGGALDVEDAEIIELD